MPTLPSVHGDYIVFMFMLIIASLYCLNTSFGLIGFLSKKFQICIPHRPYFFLVVLFVIKSSPSLSYSCPFPFTGIDSKWNVLFCLWIYLYIRELEFFIISQIFFTLLQSSSVLQKNSPDRRNWSCISDDTYEKARDKLKLAEDASDLQSSDSGFPKQERRCIEWYDF